MQFLSLFRKTWCLRMLKTFKQKRISCRGGFFEEMKAIGVENCIKFRPKFTKIQKKSIF